MTTTDVQREARTRHFGIFYGRDDPPSGLPVALVVGNCQAESLRIVLDGGGLATVSMPPVHELTAEDLPHLDRWLGRAQLLVAQPIRDDYRELPLGTAQLATRLPRGARVVRVPVLRFAGLYPVHAIIRPPGDPGATPPLVAYHDLRVLAEAATRRTGRPRPEAALTPDAVRAIAELSLAGLRAREIAHDTVLVSDLFSHPSFALMRTINHPGNPVFRELAARVRARLGLAEHDGDPGRPLLAAVHAPRLAAVIAAFGLDDELTDDWTVDGATVPDAEVREAHLRWYAERPAVIDAGLRRHADALAALGLA